MARTLSLVLDEECHISLTLMKDEAENIDKFTTGFENSDGIREQFKDQIEEFLNDNKNFIDYVKKETGKNYRGGIVLLDTLERNGTELFIEREMVLYKKHTIIYPKLIRQDVMKEFLNEDKKRAARLDTDTFTTTYMHYRIKDNNFNTKKNIEEITHFIKNGKFYEKIRLMFKAYEKLRIRNNFKTVDFLYKELINTEQEKINEEEQALIEFYKNKTPDLRDKYKDYTIEQLINSEDDYGLTR